MTETAPTSITETPQFRAAVAAEVAAQADKIRDSILASMKKPDAPVSDELVAAFQQMGMTFAEISDQGSQRKRVAPEILQQRAEAQKRLEGMLASILRKAREIGRDLTPAESRRILPWYRTVSMLYLNERKIVPFVQDPGTKKAVAVEFSWTGEPNDAMRPINGVAKAVFVEFRASRGNTEKVKGTDARPLWMTGAGLVVQGDPPSKRALPDELVKPAFENDLGLPEAIDPEAPFVHVLGTVAPAAMQNQTPGYGTRR